MNNQTKVISAVVLVVAVGLVAYFFILKKNAPVTTPIGVSTEYKNTQYEFSFSLPKTWEHYQIVEGRWSGDSINSEGTVVLGTVTGPMISIQPPGWSPQAPKQDIPIMIFTLKQWNDMQADKFHIGAAPINPSELGRNSNYVFALPARYNFSYLPGYEEVDKLIKAGSFHPNL